MAPKAGDDEIWEAEQVLGVKKNLRKKTVEVLIKWKGKPNSKNNWEEVDGSNLKDSMIEPFEDAIRALKRNKRSDTDEEVEDKEMGKDEYVVEDILGVQWNADYRQLEYYIKWEGWENQFNNWEPEANCECDELTKPFAEAADHLKSTFGPKSRKRAGPKSRTMKPASDIESDDEPVEKKRPGPKSRTLAKKPGPKSRTVAPAEVTKSEPPKRPGPKSRTTPGPASSKKPGPKSRTAKEDSEDEEETDREKKLTRKSDSDSDDDNAGDRNGNTSRFKNLSDSDGERDSDRESTPLSKKRPGPKSRTSCAGPASRKKPGPKSRTAYNGSDSD